MLLPVAVQGAQHGKEHKPENSSITRKRSSPSGKEIMLGTNSLHRMKTTSWIMLQTAALLTSYVRARCW